MTLSAEPEALAPGNEEITNQSITCWSCAAPLRKAQLFCDACGKIQPLPADVTYFDVFGLPRKLEIGTASLEKEFYRLSRRLHPDMFARATGQEQEWSLADSSLLNDAYRTLKDPIRRTEYLLTLDGDQSKPNQERAPADLLEEVFELNMQLEEMRANRKQGEHDAQLQTDLLAAKSSFDSQLSETDTKLRAVWQQWDAGVETNNSLEQDKARADLAALLDRRRYIRNLVNEVDEVLDPQLKTGF